MITDRVHVISLPERSDRRERLALEWPLPGVPVRFFTAVTAVTAGTPAGGCLASHLQLLASIGGPALVLEDDAVFAPGFTLDLDPPADWQLLWLGRQPLAPARGVIDATWARPWRIARTHAYVVRDPRAVHRLLQAAQPASIDPALSQLAVPQYMLRAATVGQGAGRSDITGALRPRDQFWNN